MLFVSTVRFVALLSTSPTNQQATTAQNGRPGPFRPSTTLTYRRARAGPLTAGICVCNYLSEAARIMSV